MTTIDPIRALDKTLRDGRRLTIDLVPQDGGTKWAYWMRASLDGIVIYDHFQTSVWRNTSPVPGLPHTISIRFTEHNPATGFDRYIDRPIGLTDAEADGLEAAATEWTERYRRAAREAAPDAPTWRISNLPLPPAVGVPFWDDIQGEPVMVVATSRRWIAEDGRSFGLDAEQGYLHTATVRALTADELAEYSREAR